MTFYGTDRHGSGLDHPEHAEKVGNDAFKNKPVGLGPYRLVSHQPGVEVVFETHTAYWRQTPSVKRLVFKSVPEATTRLAMLKQQEADIAYALYRSLAEDVRARSQAEARDRRSGGAVAVDQASWTNMTQNPPGPTAGCVWRRTTPSIGRRSTTSRPSAIRV